MNTVNTIKERYLKERKQFKTMTTFFIISICLIVLAIQIMIIARIAAGEYVNFLYATVENFNPSDEEIKNIIKDYTKLTNIICSIILGASLISTVVLYYLKLNKKKSYLSLEVQIYDSTENKQNLYD